MSWQAVQWALNDSPMLLTGKGNPDTTARQVLAVLAEHADEHGGNAHPSVLRIRYKTGFDERTIQRALLRMERAEIIRRNGFVHGCVRWRLAMALRRPDTDWTDLEAAADAIRQTESERRAARRNRAKPTDASGTENPGAQPPDGPPSGTQSAGRIEPDVSGANPVRDSASGRPGFSVPASGTQSTDVRDATPPEPPMNHQGTTKRTTHGGTLPPNPLRPQAPSGLGNGVDQLPLLGRDELPQALDGDSRPHTRGNTAQPPADDNRVWIATRRRGIQAHRPADDGLTACRRSMRTGQVLLVAFVDQPTWCPRCWPEAAVA